VLKVLFTIVIIFIQFVFTYADDKSPDWVVRGYKPEFVDERYIQAIGQSSAENLNLDKAFLQAEANARSQIAQQIQVNINSKFFVITYEDLSGKVVQDQSSEEVLATTNITLSGLMINDRYYNKKKNICYALAILDKQIAANVMHSEILSLNHKAEESLTSAKILLKECKPIKALLRLRQSYFLKQSVKRRASLLNILETVNKNDDTIPSQPTEQQLLQVLNEIGNVVQIKADKSALILKDAKELPRNIQVALFCNDEPVSHAKLSVHFKRGIGDVKILDYTDDQGISTILIKQLYSAPYGEFVFTVLPDLTMFSFPDNDDDLNPWNQALNYIFRPFVVSLEKTDLQIDDFCAGFIENLVSGLDREVQEFTLAMGNITFEEEGVSSQFIAYLKSKISNQILFYPLIKPSSPDKIRQTLSNVVDNNSAFQRPDVPEILAELSGADGILVGNYWDRHSELEFHFQIIQRRTATVLSAVDLKLPKSLIPSGMSYLPDNFQAFSQTHQLGDLEDRRDEQNVEVWVDRGNGGLYHAGEKISIFVRSVQDCYLYLIYHDADGNDLLIFPNQKQPDNRILGKIIYKIPDVRDDFDFVVQPPFGSELIKAVVSDDPLPKLESEFLYNGIKVLKNSFKDNLITLRGIAIKDRFKKYAENSCVITTVK
jgi:hypothetical protein